MFPPLRIYRDEDLTILGPCPGCEAWQLSYHTQVVGEFAVMRVMVVDQETNQVGVRVDLQPFYEVIEEALQSHLDECLHLQRFLFLDQ